MEIEEVIQTYKNTFIMDPIFSRIKNEGLDSELFEDVNYYSKISFNDSYSTTKAVEYLAGDVKEQTLINYISRNDLKSYIGASKQGRFYRYDWITIFKFKMIFLLVKHNFSPIEIAGIVGTRVETSISTTNGTSSRGMDNSVRKLVEEVTEANTKKLLHTLKTYEDYKEKQYILERKQESLTVDLKLGQERIWSIRGRLDDLEGYLSFMKITHSTNSDTTPGGGMLGWLFKPKEKDLRKQNGDIEKELEAVAEKKSKLKEAISIAIKEEAEIKLKLEVLAVELIAIKEVAASLNSPDETTIQKDFLETKNEVSKDDLVQKFINVN